MISVEVLRWIFKRAKQKDLLMFFQVFEQYKTFANLTTPVRIAGFLSQIGHETNQFLWLSELASGQAYEGRKDLGNIKLGDGKRFKGRGYIQLTGRSNYQAFQEWVIKNQKAIFDEQQEPIPNFIQNPELIATHRWAMLSAIFFWQNKKMNQYADAMDIKQMTKIVNGGLKGFEERKQYWNVALHELGVKV